MQLNDVETKKVLDEGLLTRTLIENEVAMKKCHHYSEMASDPAVKSFFKDQAKALEGSGNYFKEGLEELK